MMVPHQRLSTIIYIYMYIYVWRELCCVNIHCIIVYWILRCEKQTSYSYCTCAFWWTALLCTIEKNTTCIIDKHYLQRQAKRVKESQSQPYSGWTINSLRGVFLYNEQNQWQSPSTSQGTIAWTEEGIVLLTDWRYLWKQLSRVCMCTSDMKDCIRAKWPFDVRGREELSAFMYKTF